MAINVCLVLSLLQKTLNRMILNTTELAPRLDHRHEILFGLTSFESEDGKARYFADLGADGFEIPKQGASIEANPSFEDLVEGKDKVTAEIGKIKQIAWTDEVSERTAQSPGQTTALDETAAALAAPGEDIRVSKYSAPNFPDWEGELVSAEGAESHILGCTIDNDLPCKVFQLPAQNGGQLFYATAFDKLVPMGPVFFSPEVFRQAKDLKLVTKFNGEVMQDADIKNDMVFSAAQILSFMSQSTTIPAYTAVMTGTPVGVGAFKTPWQFLNDGDVVEIETTNIRVLRNKILFPEGKQTAVL